MLAEFLPCDQDTSAWPVIIGAVFGIVFTIQIIKMAKDPEGTIRRMAQQRANSAVLGWLRDSRDPDVQFEQLWRTRWIAPVALVGYWTAVGLGATLSIKCR